MKVLWPLEQIFKMRLQTQERGIYINSRNVCPFGLVGRRGLAADRLVPAGGGCMVQAALSLPESSVSSGRNLWIKGGLNLKQERTEQSITH